MHQDITKIINTYTPPPCAVRAMIVTTTAATELNTAKNSSGDIYEVQFEPRPVQYCEDMIMSGQLSTTTSPASRSSCQTGPEQKILLTYTDAKYSKMDKHYLA